MAFNILNYLAGRSQKVDIDGTLSDELYLDISVIQGSILGPILFLCYINDFYSATDLQMTRHVYQKARISMIFLIMLMANSKKLRYGFELIKWP
jgi:hypothetical protein